MLEHRGAGDTSYFLHWKAVLELLVDGGGHPVDLGKPLTDMTHEDWLQAIDGLPPIAG
jgi:hypothetical protein